MTGHGGIRVESGSEGILELINVLSKITMHMAGEIKRPLLVCSGNVIHLENSIITNQNTDAYH